MDFRFTDDQRRLADGLADLLEQRCPPGAVREAWETGPSRDRWRALAAMGVPGTAVPEAHGGLGLGDEELCLLLVEAGRAGLPEPLLETAAVAAPTLAAAGGDTAGAWLERIAAGDALVAVALPGEPTVAHARAADAMLLADDGGLRLVPAGQLAVTDQPSVDGGRPTATVAADPDAGTRLDAGPGLVARAADRAATGAAAVMLGLGRRMLRMATDHARQREQFGRPIGSFQAIKHRLADAVVALELAAPVVHRAAHTLATDGPGTGRDASMAKVFAAEAAGETARTALQVHGAIGYTWEHDLHLWMKRVWALQAAYGTTDQHRDRVADAVLPA